MKKYYRYLALLLIFTGFLLCIKSLLLSTTAKKASFIANSSLILIVDPGHGGADGGANLNNVFESSINLSIAKKLDCIMGLFAVPIILTRQSEDIEYPSHANTIREKKVFDTKRRVELINSVPNAVLLSIHQNKFPDSYPHGAQSFFAKTSGSEELALKLQELLVKNLDPENKREARKIDKGIYLMNNIECPAALVECGFISNPREFELLQSESYQIKIAACLSAAFLNTKGYLEEIHGEV